MYKQVMQDDCDVRQVLTAYALSGRTPCGRDICWHGTRVIVSLIMCCEEAPRDLDGPPSMTPPSEPPPDLMLPPVDSFEGYIPPCAPASAAKLQPPWT